MLPIHGGRGGERKSCYIIKLLICNPEHPLFCTGKSLSPFMISFLIYLTHTITWTLVPLRTSLKKWTFFIDTLDHTCVLISNMDVTLSSLPPLSSDTLRLQARSSLMFDSWIDMKIDMTCNFQINTHTDLNGVVLKHDFDVLLHNLTLNDWFFM